MFGFKKKEKKPLFIEMKNLISIIKSDYEEGVAFCLAEFIFRNEGHTIGSCLLPNSDERKENIFFVFDDAEYHSYEEFIANAEIDGILLSRSDAVIEITRAGIIDGDAMIRSPWDDTRLAKFAVKDK